MSKIEEDNASTLDFEHHLQQQSEVAIGNFINLIRSRISLVEDRIERGRRGAKKQLSPWTDPGGFIDDFKVFVTLYDAPEKQQTRMWPVRKPEFLLKFLEEKESKKGVFSPRGSRSRVKQSPIQAEEYADDITRLFFDAELTIRNDKQIIIELEYLRHEIVGMYEAKKKLMYFMFSFFMGGGKLSATGLNVVLGGNPGTGKTSIAEVFSKLAVLLGWIQRPSKEFLVLKELDEAIERNASKTEAKPEYKTPFPERPSESPYNTKTIEELIPSDRRRYLLVTSREDFVAGWLGQTALRTLSVIRSSVGMVLFIDEAYSIAPSPDDTYGLEALNTLVNWIPRLGAERLSVYMLAGYVDRLRNDFFRRNEGLESRFPLIFILPNYTPSQLTTLFFRFMHEGTWIFPKKIKFPKATGITRRSRAIMTQYGKRWDSADVPPAEDEETTDFLGAFFAEFAGIFAIGNVRKLQNFFGQVEISWAETKMLDDREEKSIAWADKLRKEFTPEMMFLAMERTIEVMVETSDVQSKTPLAEFPKANAKMEEKKKGGGTVKEW